MKAVLNTVGRVPGNGEGKIAGRYRVLQTLGQGGMGTVWLAHDELLDRHVAVKALLLPESLTPAEREEALQRATREAMAAAQLRHPNIITVHDVLTHDGLPTIVMEMLKGRDLKDAVAAEGQWAPERAAAVGLRVLDALVAAHAHGIQHRDVKPANVFLTDDGRVVLTDFGIARLEDQATITESGLLIGSPGYIAPERLRGERGGPASDLWSLGATLYAAVEGQAPYSGTSPMTVLRDALTRPPRPPERAGRLGPVLMQLLAREPHQRPDARLTGHLLRQVAEGGPATTALMPAPRRANRRGPVLIGAGLLAAVAAVATTAALLPRSAPTTPRPAASADTRPATSAPVRTPSATPSATATAARFSGPVDVCTLMTPTQVRSLVPKASPKGSADEEGCEWTADGNGVGVSPVPLSSLDSAWGLSVDEATETFVNRLNGADSGAVITWNWPDVGIEEALTQTSKAYQEVNGIGDEAFSYELVDPRGQVARHDVIFRTSNVVMQIQYFDAKKIGDNESMRKGARDAARWVAAALERQG
ncbi:serine/threonine protein kinase [Nonomuraea longispora]|uniref:non-specific serine/threonine protein kinase n=1 Tax=Nonomuraea longispora TaxID=1848320 RepID=A0A4R4MIR7_9ACTN|nr:serine/threonine-protein kinase [Nonomuraea longispora]TDB93669.1 serine/threonine protein kinase [Nonomuraea longispora]